jgi:hypothetical protein
MRKFLYILLGLGLLVVCGVGFIAGVRMGYFNLGSAVMTDDMLVYESFGVQGSWSDTALYNDGRLVVVCEGVPVCSTSDVSTTTYQVSTNDMATITQNLSKVTSRVTQEYEPGVLSESSFQVETNFKGRHLVHTGTNQEIDKVLEIISETIKASRAVSQ